MANYQNIMRLRPEVRDFVRNRRWVHRGDVITYGANVQCGSFSTDARGYRHSTFRGQTLSVADCARSDRYGLVLGPSNVYGFGLAGNENTMPSLLAERFGFPFGNVGLPEGNSRTLFSILLGIAARAPRPPSVIVHISGGDYTNFCYTGLADPLFGSPNLKQIEMALQERKGRLPPPEKQIESLLSFTSLWIRAIAELCHARGIALVLGHDTTFFEKRQPSEIEIQSELGKPFGPAQERQFAMHKRFATDYSNRREGLAGRLGIPLAGPGMSNDIGFVDEFHYDREGTRALCDDFAAAIETVLR
ncbi:hypothetical protein [Sphingomonas hankyongi]|uniref:SGNH hydrolase-type esterase domain-containing protein n=1 Tax=Sphingomonas hankyongi TaxID=2908209 RepID=A0ABT0RZQ3_9SPHN|nr:hypothetical protein [Sphingomonas hankyongi]MCL6729092.1 hypothetical protein [Sphingomonas hankyongi]